MRRWLMVACCWLMVSTASAQLDRIRVSGNQFVNAAGKSVVFRGLNASDPAKLSNDKHWDKSYFEEIKNWGATLVRIPVHPMHWRTLGTEKYLALLDEGVQWAGELGLYVIIDWHSIGNLREARFTRASYNTTFTETLEFWKTIAHHYKNNTTVAFFELFNEPTLDHGALGTCTWAQWKTMMEEMITLIRSHDAEAIPLVAGFNWAYDLTDVKNNPIAAEEIAYVSHPYPMKREKPWEPQWTTDWGFVAKKYPVFLTEIGFCGPDDKGAHIPVISDESYGEAITAYADANNISYTVWVFDPQWSPMLFSDWNYTPTRQGKFFKAVLQRYKE